MSGKAAVITDFPDATRERLAKLLGLLGSEHDGERATAGRMASDLVRQHRLTWAELLALRVVERPGTACAEREAARGSWREAVAFLCRVAAERPALFTTWERGFVVSLGRQARLSARQEEILLQMLDRVIEAGG
jgi:hypothetical protein